MKNTFLITLLIKVFFIYPSHAAGDFKLGHCENTPPELITKLKKDYNYLEVGGVGRVDSMSNITSFLIIKNQNSCRQNSCKYHFFKNNKSGKECEYRFSVNLPDDIFINQDIFLNTEQKYQSDCRLYFDGFCIRR